MRVEPTSGGGYHISESGSGNAGCIPYIIVVGGLALIVGIVWAAFHHTLNPMDPQGPNFTPLTTAQVTQMGIVDNGSTIDVVVKGDATDYYMTVSWNISNNGNEAHSVTLCGPVVHYHTPSGDKTTNDENSGTTKELLVDAHSRAHGQEADNPFAMGESGSLGYEQADHVTVEKAPTRICYVDYHKVVQ